MRDIKEQGSVILFNSFFEINIDISLNLKTTLYIISIMTTYKLLNYFL